MEHRVYSLPKKRMGELFGLISSSRQLFLPMEKGGQFQFSRVDEHTDLEGVSLDRLLTAGSAKELFFPQTQQIAAFRRRGKEIELTSAETLTSAFVAFGVRACDARSLEVLDRAFLGTPRDTMYEEKRSKGTVVTLACNEPEETCFCSVFSIDAASPKGDVETWIAGDTLYWRPGSEKGAELTQELDALLDPCSEEEPEGLIQLKQQIRSIIGKLPLGRLSLEQFRPEALQELFDDPAWQKLSEPCIGCGTCTFVCPTCQCFDIRDFDTGEGVQRFRCWDSCMYSDFTTMAHGNPRTSQVERFRQRFMHKLVYYPANHDGLYSCAGCGRCVSKCPNSMNMVKVMKTLGGAQHV